MRWKSWALPLVILFLFVATATVVILLPRPDIVLASSRVDIGPCAPSGTSRSVTAMFTLTNRGTGAGTVWVVLYVDRQLAGYQMYAVAAGGTIQEEFVVTLADCGTH